MKAKFQHPVQAHSVLSRSGDREGRPGGRAALLYENKVNSAQLNWCWAKLGNIWLYAFGLIFKDSVNNIGLMHLFIATCTTICKVLSTDKKKKKITDNWIKPKRSPTEKEKSQCLAEPYNSCWLLEWTMDNHVYQFENQVRLQKKGGPIG